MKTYRAILLTFNDVSEKIQEKIDKRTLDFLPEFKAYFEHYNEPLQISVLNEYANKVIEYFALNGCKLSKEPEGIFRAMDYTYVQDRILYTVHCDGEDIIHHIERYKKTYNLNENPAFQRGYVWSDEQRRYYIEFLISGGVSGRDIYLNVPNWNSYGKRGEMMLVDGKQRLSAIIDFMSGKFTIFDGVSINDLRFSDKARIFVKFNINDITDYKEIVRWYIAMNTGGSKHTEQDLEIAYAELNK